MSIDLYNMSILVAAKNSMGFIDSQYIGLYNKIDTTYSR